LDWAARGLGMPEPARHQTQAAPTLS